MSQSLTRLVVVCIAGLMASMAIGQTKEDRIALESASVPKILSELRQQYLLPALAGGTVCTSGETEIGVVGLRRLGAAEAAGQDDLFHLGSVTKSMTATMLATLVEEGKLGWESTVEELAPEWAPRIHEAYRTVTLRQLLSHTAGVSDPWTAEQWASLPYDAHTPGRLQRQRMALEVLSRDPIGPPGEVWQYANVGYGIAASLAELVTGEEWEDLMRHRLFEPLGLSTAGFGWPVTDQRLDQPWGHVVEEAAGPGVIDGLRVWGPNHPHRIPIVIAPAGDVHMSVADFTRYALLHLRGARGEPTEILTARSFAELHTPLLEGYALGWNVVPDGTSRLPGIYQLQHLGSGGTFTSVIALFPKIGLAAVAVHNGGSNRSAVADAMYTLVEASKASSGLCDGQDP
jgi:CubicO group peptidase (beta-lactamase class C family)